MIFFLQVLTIQGFSQRNKGLILRFNSAKRIMEPAKCYASS